MKPVPLITTEDAALYTGLEPRTIRRHCIANKYPGAVKDAEGRWIIPVPSLPIAAQTIYHRGEEAETAPLPVIAPPPSDIDTEALFLAYRRAPIKSKTRADTLSAAVMQFEDLINEGETKGNAAKIAGIDYATLWRARELVKAHPREQWAARLLPRYKGRAKEAVLTPAAWDWIKSNYLNTSETAAKVVIKEAKKIGKAQGWEFPSNKTITRRLNKLPAPQWLLGRKGSEALDATYPAAERDYLAYGLHEQWVSDGTRADVLCIWPDGTIARPFVVAWMDMRTRLICGARGGVNPSQSLTLASLREALLFVNTKPDFALLDNGPEYAGKQVTGGQQTRYRFQNKEGDPIGALTRMGIKVDWARPYRGQEKPIEKFWDYVKNHLDKSSQFQGAYCGKDTASKPADYGRKNAVPVETYAAKLAEVLAEYNREHEHSGHGMGGRPPAQVYEEIMQTAPHKVWARPTAEDLRLLCLEQRMLTLNNKDASIKFKIEGYGELRYWSGELAALPISARAKKYSVFHNPAAPELPVLIYDGVQFICESACIDKVGNKEQAAQHCIKKAAFINPHKTALKAIKNAAPLALHAPIAANETTPAIIIEKPAAPPEPIEKTKLVKMADGMYYDPEAGAVIGKGTTEKPNTEEINEGEIERLLNIKAQREAAHLEKRFGTA